MSLGKLAKGSPAIFARANTAGLYVSDVIIKRLNSLRSHAPTFNLLIQDFLKDLSSTAELLDGIIDTVGSASPNLQRLLADVVTQKVQAGRRNEAIQYNIIWFMNQFGLLWINSIHQLLSGVDPVIVTRDINTMMDNTCTELRRRGTAMNPDISTHSPAEAIVWSKYMWWGMTSLCNYCGREASKFCMCYLASYCDKTCQRADWPTHKNVCAARVRPSGAGSSRKRTRKHSTTRRRKQKGGCAPLRPAPLPTPTVYQIEGDNLLL